MSRAYMSSVINGFKRQYLGVNGIKQYVNNFQNTIAFNVIIVIERKKIPIILPTF